MAKIRKLTKKKKEKLYKWIINSLKFLRMLLSSHFHSQLNLDMFL